MILRHLIGFLRKHGRISNGALKRSLSTNIREKNPYRQRYKDDNVVVTVNPNKFAEKKQQRLRIGDLQSFRPHIAEHEESSYVMSSSPLYYDSIREPGMKMTNLKPRSSYPPDTKAFLYYFTSPERPRIAGELRLRVAPSDDPASFESGSDLLLPNGRPWSRSLCTLPKYGAALYGKLREERLVPDDLDAALSTLHSKVPRYRYNQLLYTLNDTFVVDLSRYKPYFTVVTEEGMEDLVLEGAFWEWRTTHEGAPYTGRVLARFERSTLPGHKGTRTVVLRILKLITPVNCVVPLYDGYIGPPKEGELHWTRRYSTANSEIVWSINIDKSKSKSRRGLQLLWDK